MNPKDQYAANFARKAAESKGAEYATLSSLMCWNAVEYCALKVDIINQDQFNRIKQLDPNTVLASRSDQKVLGADGLLRLSPGNVLVFFEGETAIHAMINIWKGKAAGNKNDCVGVGHSIGWEVLDLSSGLPWAKDGSINAPLGVSSDPKNLGKKVTRTVFIHTRPISYLAYK